MKENLKDMFAYAIYWAGKFIPFLMIAIVLFIWGVFFAVIPFTTTLIVLGLLIGGGGIAWLFIRLAEWSEDRIDSKKNY